MSASAEKSPSAKSSADLAATDGAARIQFTLRSMLAATAIASLWTAGLYAFPAFLSGLVAIVCFFTAPAALLCCLVYGKPTLRAYALGALLPYVTRLFVGGAFAAVVREIYADQPIRFSTRPNSRSADFGECLGVFLRVLDDTGPALMTEETLILAASLTAGSTSLVTWRLLQSRQS